MPLPSWPGATVVIVAGGPSLTLAQVRHVANAWFERCCKVIAVNDALYPCWWADWLHACDGKWIAWHEQAVAWFTGHKTSLTVPEGTAARLGIQIIPRTGADGFEPQAPAIRTGKNGAYQAMHLAVHAGAKRLLLLGVDMCAPDGATHWHGGHPDGVSCDMEKIMLPKFATLAEPLRERNVEVVNCSPGSALTLWPMAKIEDVL